MKTPVYSELWGKAGENWSRQSRLPDFSYAGCHRGELSIATIPEVCNLRDFGAVGDGEHDDTEAFRAAIAHVSNGAIRIPAGRYKLTDRIDIDKAGVVLRGDGPDQTTLFFPYYLNDIHPNWGSTTSGKLTSNYSWSGGYLSIQGSYRSDVLANIVEPACRGDKLLAVSSADCVHVGQQVEVFLKDTAENSLARHLYSEDPGDDHLLLGSTTASLVARVTAIDGNRIFIDRPLRFDVRSHWEPVIRKFEPTVREVGVENLCFEFPVRDYEGHFTELGFNAIALDQVADCWVRNVLVRNADSGLIVKGKFCTIEGLVFESDRKADPNSGCTGHHGVYFYDDDNKLCDFDFRSKFIHDITVSRCAGTVCADGKGMDICFDHHKRAPFENLYTNIDIGAGTRMWMCGGGAALGRHCAARGTFWNFRAAAPQKHPGTFGPDSINLVAVHTDLPSDLSATGKWFEAIRPAAISPQNIYQAQLNQRLGDHHGQQN